MACVRCEIDTLPVMRIGKQRAQILFLLLIGGAAALMFALGNTRQLALDQWHSIRALMRFVPGESHEILLAIVAWLSLIAVVVCWTAGSKTLKKVCDLANVQAAACARCHYPLAGLADNARCPECDAGERAQPPTINVAERRFIVGIGYAIGALALAALLNYLNPRHPLMTPYWVLSTLPVIVLARRQGLTARESSFIVGVTFLTISGGIAYAVWGSAHDADAQGAAFGVAFAPWLGWGVAGAGYLVASWILLWWRRAHRPWARG